MPETAHGREYYLAKAEEHPFFWDAVEGSASFRGRIDDLVIGLLSEKGDLGKTLTEFRDLTNAIAESSPEAFDVKSCNMSAEYIRRYRSTISNIDAAFVYGASAGYLLFIPPFQLVEAFLFGLGTLGVALNAPAAYRGWKARNNAIEVFAPVCSAAVALDEDIGKAFLMDDFLGRKERFGETYQALAPEERAEVGAGLRRMLSAGALDIGEAELEEMLEQYKQPWE